MILPNGVPAFDIPGTPEGLFPHISWCAQCQMLSTEKRAVSLAMQAFWLEFSSNPRGHRLAGINILCIDSSEFSLQLDNDDEMGLALRIIVLPLHHWRRKALSIPAMIICMLEELCHALYVTDDELEVEHLVLACARRLWPNACLSDLYNPHWKPDDKHPPVLK